MTTEWHGCYNDSWNGILVPDAFAHPAKFAPGLAYHIYRHMLDAGYIAPGDGVVDPFGGIGGGGYHAMLLGLHWTGIELEPRFVELGNRNIAKWRHDLRMLNGRLGTARLVQGDSRRLDEIVGGMGAAVSSPPFSGDKNLMAVNGQGVRSEMVDRHGKVESDSQQSPGNLAALRADDAGFSAAVSSPPYADAVNGSGEGPGARHDPIYHNGDNAYKQSSDAGYGDTPGNLGSMAGDGFEAAVSSPPYEASIKPRGDGIDWDKACERGHRSAGRGAIADGYGASAGNIGNDQGETFWSAARVIVEQTYAVLRPGGYAAWVTKRFVRKGQIVEFSDQWETLCAAVGFEPVERIHALLVDDHGEQLDIFGGATARRKERKSFFRRLAEKKGSPRIDHEDVIIMRRPV